MSGRKKILIVVSVVLAVAIIVSLAIWSNIEKLSKKTNSIEIYNMLTEYIVNPVGVDKEHPVFSWSLKSDIIGQKQTAYKIVVSTDKKFKNKVWDSGKRNDDETVGIKYDGGDLKPSTRYYWKVYVWDKDGHVAESDTLTYFETGLLSKDAWKDAKWIKLGSSGDERSGNHYTIDFDLQIEKDSFGLVFGAKGTQSFYMWQFNTHDYPGKVYLRPHVYKNGAYQVKEFNITSNISVTDIKNKSAHIRIEVKEGKISTYVNGTLVNTFDDSSITFGDIGFRSFKSTDTDERAFIDNLVVKAISSGQENEIINCDFESNNVFSDIEVKDGRLYTYASNGEKIVLTDGGSGGLPLFRKEFPVSKGLESVKVYSTALGVYDLFVNGKRVGRTLEDGTIKYDELKPGWTDYNVRALYYSYDITDYISNGDNAIGAIVSSGWWTGRISYGAYGYRETAFCAKIVIKYRNGDIKIISTDDTWQTKKGGPIIKADIYDGETYNANYASPDWTKAGFDAADWFKASVYTGYNGAITAHLGDTVQVRDELSIKPVSAAVYQGVTKNSTNYGIINVVKTYGEGEGFTLLKGQSVIFDMGQNMVGWPYINVKGNKDTVITMRFAEMLNDSGKTSRGNDGPEGSLYRANYRSAVSENKYIMSGAEEGESYRTSMSFYGFRYVEITATDDIEIRSIIGEVVGNATVEAGSIITNDESINRLYLNVLWGQRGNYLSVPTDCPQRDERLGWTGDTQIFAHAATYNANVAGFFHKWLQDLRDSQTAAGSYTDVVPAVPIVGSTSNGAWTDAGVIVPYTMYMMYKDRSILEDSYGSMKKYMNYLSQFGYDGPGTAYGDWLAYEATDSRYISVCYYAYDAMLMKEIADILGNDKDSENYRKLYEDIKGYFQSKYIKNGKLTQGSQTGCILALKMKLLPDSMVYEVIDTLVSRIQKNKDKLSTGFVGTGYIVEVLSEYGRADMAYALLLQRDNPSWLYSLDQGATTIWERWNSYTLATGFGDAGMNSFNHYAYGAVSAWMFRYMAGIEAIDSFKEFKLQPQLDPEKRINRVEATYMSVYGEILSKWELTDDEFTYTCVVPANTTAVLELPDAFGNAKSIKINGKDYSLDNIDSGSGVSFVEYIEGNMILLKLQSGRFDITLSR